MAKPVAPARWDEAVDVEAAEKALSAARARLDQVTKQGHDAAALAERIPAQFAEAYSTSVLIGGELPKQDPAKDAQLREAVTIKEASAKAVPALRAQVEVAKKRVADARALLTTRQIAWADEEQERVVAEFRDYVAGALPHVARLMAIGKLRDTFVGKSFKVTKDIDNMS